MLHKNIEKIESILKNNNYPKYFIRQVFNNFFKKSKMNKIREKAKYFKFPNIPNLSNKIRKLLENEDVCNIATYNLQTTRTLFSKLKDPKKSQ